MESSPTPTPTPTATPVSTPIASTCQNCRSPLLGDFCYECGQPKRGWIRHINGIAGDFLDSVFNFDSRTLRTIGPLFFRPGFLSIEYFAGRRVRYVTPLRLYFFLSVIAFLLVGLNTPVKTGDGFISVGTGETSSPEDQLEKLKRLEQDAVSGLETAKEHMPAADFDVALKEIRDEFGEDRNKLLAEIEQRKRDQGLTFSAGEKPEPRALIPKTRTTPATAEDPNPQGVQVFTDGPWHPTRNPTRVSWLGETGNAWLNEKIGLMIRNGQEVNRDPGKLVAEMFAEAPTMLFVLLPFFALMLKGFYLFKRRLYMEHIIVALHSHSFICFSIILIALMIQLQKWVGAESWISSLAGLGLGAVWIWMPIHLLLAQKRIYRQGWIMTLLKFFAVGFCYLFMLMFGLMALILSSLVNL
ncbi:MAG: DUF3667 domain-containing protein [Ahniella sp.]|nr:DUF3667 domain-containing protein [Ahniella sp.]